MLREGSDLTLVAYGPMVKVAMDAAEAAEEEGVGSLEVIDLRSLVPLDEETLVASAARTGRMVVVHEAPQFLGMGAEVAARVTEAAFFHLEAPCCAAPASTSLPAGPARGSPPARRRPGPLDRPAEPGLLAQEEADHMAEREFKLPDLGEGLTEGEVVRWLVAEGDAITLNQPIVEVETAKAVVEIPAPYAGTVVKLHAGEGDTLDVGAP